MKPLYDIKAIRAQMDAVLQRIDQAILANLRYLGELCVNHARSLDTYRDVTGNLRSSIGYVVTKNGKVVYADFERNMTKTPGQRRKRNYGKNGVLEGERLARSLAKNYPAGWALIVVAGMNYAAKVESKGKDVITSAELIAKTELPLMIAKLKQSIDKMRA